jgi:hypothetical protein
LFANYTPSLSAIFIDSSNQESSNGHKIVNCSFENLRDTGMWPASIGVYDLNAKYNLTECFFRNISSNNGSIRAGAINCDMTIRNDDGYFNISGNTFIEIKTNKSVVLLYGSFLSLIFSYNSFYNVSSIYEGGVFKFNKFI